MHLTRRCEEWTISMADKIKLEVRNAKISFWTNNGYVRAVRDVSFKLKEGKNENILQCQSG